MKLRKHLWVALRTALATVACLFGLQLWYSSYLDVNVIHGDLSAAPVDAKLETSRAEEQAKLSSGTMPIAQAMAAVAQRGRKAFPQLAAKPSNDLSAMSGWMHRPGFKVYVPRAEAALPGAKP